MRLARKFALGWVTTCLIALVAPVGASAIETPAISIDKMLQTSQPGYYTPGDTITYRYEVTGNDRFINVKVTDDKCGAVTPVLGTGGVYNVGDTMEPFGALNGLAGEKWIFTCATTAPVVADPGATFTNKAEVTAIVPTPGWDQFQGITFRDDDTFTLKAAILRKQVVLYWDYVHAVPYAPAADVPFAVDVINGTTTIGTETVKAGDPLELWFAPGTWKLQEKTPTSPYTLLRGTWNDVLSGSWRDNTFFNLIDFDLSIDKYGPAIATGGGPVSYTYKVKNHGPATVTPVVTDDTCSPVKYVSGDKNADGKIQPTEHWAFKCTYTPSWSAVFNAGGGRYLVNTARVAADEYPEAWVPVFGGDDDPDNDTDTYKLYAFVLRKDVGLYANGAHPNFASFKDTQKFTVKAYRSGSLKKTFTIAENAPKYLWLSHGSWKFKEVSLPKGYMAFYPDATIRFATGSGYPDWTHLNVTWSACSRSYWKHHTPWPATYLRTDRVDKYFTGSGYGASTLAQALAFSSGPGVPGAERILLRQAVATLLNEARYGTASGPYPSVSALKTAVNTALAGDDRGTMITLSKTLEHWNQGVCR
jgi:hypothetical protein